nr:unnamed protein product [Callosobruchus analis]
MAKQAGCVSSSSCKRCKSNVINGVKCIECLCSYHISCAKHLNLKNVSASSVLCCKNVTNSIDDGDNAFFDAMEELAIANDNKLHHKAKRYHKELQEKVKLLNDQITILNNPAIENSVAVKNVPVKKVDTKPKQKETKHTLPDKSRGTDKSTAFTYSQVSAADLDAQEKTKCEELININNDVRESSNVVAADNEGWEKVKRRRYRTAVVGSFSDVDSSIKGVEKMVSIHVSRLAPSTTAEELWKLLKPKFPEAKCEPLQSLRPDIYSSFKVSLSHNNLKSAMDASNWPKNTESCQSRVILDDNQSKFSPNLLHLNIGTINTDKINQLAIDIQNYHNLHLICLNETGLKSVSINLVTIPKFNLVSSYCRSVHNCGGVAIWAKNHILASGIDLSIYCIEKDFEICGVRLKLYNKSYIVLAYYRSPSGDKSIFLSKINIVMDFLYQPNINFILCGDINLDSLICNRYFDLLCMELSSFNIFPVVQEPTRVTANSSTSIDHIFTDISHKA